MKLYQFLRQEAADYDLRMTLATMLTGLVNGLMITVVLNAAGTPRDTSAGLHALLSFLLLLVTFMVCRRYTALRNMVVVEEIIARVRVRLTEKVRRADVHTFQQMPRTELFAILAARLHTIGLAARQIADAGSPVVMIVFALGYVAYLSPIVFIATVTLLALGTLHYVRTEAVASTEISAAIVAEQDFYRKLDHLLQGFKEVRLNQPHSDDLQRHMNTLIEENRRLRSAAARRFAVGSVVGASIFYVLVGAIVFLLPIGSPTLEVRAASVILFIMGPVEELVSSLPFFAQGQAALRQLQRMEAALDRAVAAAADERLDLDDLGPLRTLGCRDLCFRYDDTPGVYDPDAFRLGPIELEMRPGEIMFVIGGNGTGKSTFITLLCALYRPTSGALLFNGREITTPVLPAYRRRFAIISQDYHLFDRVYGVEMTPERLDRTQQRLRELALADLTSITPDGTITNTRLSAGQRKRLALVIAELHEPDVFILDEWAADQDPQQRAWFYTTLLPELRAAGKLVLVATHDDAWFGHADRWFRMHDGQLTEMRYAGGKLEPLSSTPGPELA